MASASRELLAAPEAAWAFLVEPHHLADWWPGVVAVEPDRRGFATGARWRVARRGPRGLLGLPGAGPQGRVRQETLVIEELVAGRRWSWQLVGVGRRLSPARSLRVTIELEPAAPDRTRLRVEVDSGRLGSGDAATARIAAERLYALLQTAATL